ncbi:sodium-coupled monocarboxylate transporter 1-like [Periplaneta americana]|uniref:sodium-coupled monocarboxylate transporter 1-like n=1 Tax=Periplaneta americana TaxID=6978 RepID=UPI0037E8D188
MNVTEGNGVHVSKYFSWLDFLVFGIMLCLSALIGVYFAFFAKKKQNTTSEYLMGGKTMGIFPISMSLIASYISGISLLGLPAEMYVYGTQYMMIMCPEAFVSVTMALVYLPVFYKLQITSSYEYLNLRFSQTVRLMGSIIFIVKMMLYIPIVIYVPALAFSQVTGVNLHLITPIVCVVCIFYTTLGGLKAVVWTDTLQTFLMFGGVIIVMILGTINVGGPNVVWERSEQSGRLEFFNLNIDPTVRHTFWNVSFGNYFYWLASCSVNQAMVQRCLAMPTIYKANITILILALGILGIVTMSCYTGLVIYATFYNCDPVSTHTIGKADQLLPYFVMEISESVPGLPGIFMSGVFSAALSSMSTGLNSMTGVIFEDLIRPVIKRPISEAYASLIMKVIVALIGTICVGMVFLVEHMGTLVQAGKSLAGITAGSLLGVFSLGMFFPWANAKGALAGGVLSMAFVGWISIGSQIAIAKGFIKFPTKPVSIEGCEANLLNSTVMPAVMPVIMQEPLYMYRISYMWYTLIGVVTAITVGLVVSFLTQPNRPQDVNTDLLTPVIHRFLPSKEKRIELQDYKQDMTDHPKESSECQHKE